MIHSQRKFPSINLCQRRTGQIIKKNLLQDYFEINETSGWIYVNGKIDRETAKTIMLSVMVIDEHASISTKPQYDTGSICHL